MSMDKDEVIERLMADYDRQFPNADDFARSNVRYEYNKTLAAIRSAGLTVTDAQAPLSSACSSCGLDIWSCGERKRSTGAACCTACDAANRTTHPHVPR